MNAREKCNVHGSDISESCWQCRAHRAEHRLSADREFTELAMRQHQETLRQIMVDVDELKSGFAGADP